MTHHVHRHPRFMVGHRGWLIRAFQCVTVGSVRELSQGESNRAPLVPPYSSPQPYFTQ